MAEIPKWEDTSEVTPTWDTTHEPLPVQQLEEPSQAEALVRGAGQGLSLGFSDELVGALQAAAGKLQGEEPDLADLYRQYRDIQRAKELAASEAHPYTYGGGQLAGGIATALVPGTLGLKGALATGALAGAGTSEADLTKGEVGQLASEAAGGAALSGGIFGAGKALGWVGSKIAKSEPVEEFVKAFKQGKSGAELTSPEALRQYEKQLFDKSKEFGQALTTGPEGLYQAAIDKANAIKKYSTKNIDLSEASKTFDDIVGAIDRRGLSEAQQKTLDQTIKDVSGVLKEKEVTIPTIKELVQKFERVPSSTEEAQKIAEKEAARRIALGETAQAEIVPFEAGGAQFEQPGVRLSKPGVNGTEQTLQPIGSPLTKSAEVPEFSTGTKYAEDILTKQPINTSEIPLSTAETFRSSLSSKAAKSAVEEVPSLKPAIERTRGAVSQAINEIGDIKDINQRIVALKNLTEVFNVGKDLLDEEGNKINVASLFEKMDKGGISGAKARQIIEEGFKDLEKYSPEMASKFRSELTDIVEKYTLAKQAQSGGIFQLVSPKAAPTVYGGLAGEAIKGLEQKAGKTVAGAIENIPSGLTGTAKKALSDQSLSRAGALTDIAGAKDVQRADLSKAQINTPTDLSSDLESRSSDQLRDVAKTLQYSTVTRHLGEQLQKAIEAKDSKAKTQAIFAISQIPGARKILLNK